MSLSQMMSCLTLAGLVGLGGCDAANQAHERTVAQRKQDEEIERVEAASERVRLVQEGYTLVCQNIISKTVPDAFGRGNSGYKVGVIDDKFFLNGDDDFFEVGTRLRGGERLRFAQHLAVSISTVDAVTRIVNKNEQGGIEEREIKCK